MREDLISVIVPIYNVQVYLERCINSLVSQTYNKIEIILVDDGSTDSSGEIAEKWAKKDDRIVVLHKKNGGLSDARNYGIKMANGKYLSFVDSDDYVDERFIETLYRLCINTGSKISAIDKQSFSDVDLVSRSKNIDEELEILDKETAMKYLYTEEKYANYAWNKLYLKELFDDVKYPYGRKMEDLGTTYLLFDKCDFIAYKATPLYFYYQRNDSILHNPDCKFYIDKFELSSERYEYVKRKYPNMRENYSFYFFVILEGFPYISKEKRMVARKEAVEIWPTVKEKCGNKTKAKYILLKYFPNIYAKGLKKC